MTDGIEDVRRRSPNFGFLWEQERLLVLYGAGAESLVYTDPNGALVKCRQFVEVLTAAMIRATGIQVVEGAKLANRIYALADAGALLPPAAQAFHDVRSLGNRAVHEHYADRHAALEGVKKCFELGLLFYRAVSGDRSVVGFVPPQPPAETPSSEIETLRSDLERYQRDLEDALLTVRDKASLAEAEAEARARAEAELARARSEQARLAAQVQEFETVVDGMREEFDLRFAAGVEPVAAAERQRFVDRARLPEPLNEAQARRTIDAMLVEAGWILQDSDELNPLAALGVAVREFQLTDGAADYVLYVDQKIVGIVEAKREGTPLIEVEQQSARYAEAIPQQLQLAVWRRELPLPFRYESTGAETRFTNGLDPDARSRTIFTFHRPDTIARWMARADEEPEAPTFRAQVRRMPDVIEDDLRPAQIDAIKSVETSLGEDHPRTLVQMATGAGKTWAAVALSYRLLRHAKASRVLFLVDRNNLGDQAAGEFRNYPTPDDGRKLSELYNVQRLAAGVVPESTHVVVTTIQWLDLALRGQPLPSEDDDPTVDELVPDRPVDAQYNQTLPPETFDLIVVDECHRSIYGKWRAVLEYFDAPIVGLTATPTAQTLGFFDQNLASEYTYEHAVADGVNVDFDVYRIRTKISESGSTIPALDEDGTQMVVPVRDRRTRRQRYEQLEEDFTYAGEQIGRSVLAKDQIRTVVRTFKDRVLPEMFPQRTTVPKTLIFAKTDEHADDIVQIVRDVFGKGNDFATKITYRSKVEGNDPKRLLQLFRTSPDLRIAVTVDMIATGTDVKPLEVVFFLRGVKSAVYFEQMKGRGARTVDEADFQRVNIDPVAKSKDRFVIVDAVGVTDNPLCDARPLERDPKKRISLQQLLQKAANLSLGEDETATLTSRLSRLDHQISDEDREELTRVGDGTSVRSIVARLANAIDTDALIAARDAGGEEAVQRRLHDAVAPLAGNPALRQRILDIRRQYDTMIDEVSQDEVLDARGLPRSDRARSAVTSFRQYLQDHQDLVVVQQLRHGSAPIPYSELRALADTVKRLPNVYSVDFLRKSYEEMGVATSVGDGPVGITELVSILRYELGLDSEVRPFRSVVEERFAAWVERQKDAGAAFTPEQRWHLDRIVDVIATAGQITVDDLYAVPFTERGGVQGFAHAFGNRAESLLDELNEELTA